MHESHGPCLPRRTVGSGLLTDGIPVDRWYTPLQCDHTPRLFTCTCCPTRSHVPLSNIAAMAASNPLGPELPRPCQGGPPLVPLHCCCTGLPCDRGRNRSCTGRPPGMPPSELLCETRPFHWGGIRCHPADPPTGASDPTGTAAADIPSGPAA